MLAKLAALNISLPAGHVCVGEFGDSEELSEQLLDLIRQGKKRAGTGLVWAHEFDNEPIGQLGEIEIVVDHHGEPAIITRATRVAVVPFNQVTAEYATVEGEGDGSLEDWRKGHWAFYCRECRRIGREPSEDMPVVCCEFEVLHVLPRGVRR